jgi:hypothetical protein
LYDTRTGNFGTIDFISPVLSGNNVQLVVKLYNYNNGGSQTSKYYIEEYRVFKDKGPCSVSAITVTAAAGNGGILTCTNPSLTLSASATGSGTTTYSWTGPNGYTSAVQNPLVSAGGTYTVVATNSTGSGSASITVTENKTGPVITATGGNLACGSSTTISATANIGNASYSWTGPNSFSSLQQNPTVSAAGNYTVTVTNPANGCFAQQTVAVTASTATVFWQENFALANGTTARSGAIAWTTATAGTGTYSVQNNEFKTSFSGGAEGVWTSGIIDISNKSNVSFSVNLRSETAGSSDFFEPGDYCRVYYKLNGGAETQVFNDAAGLGNTTTGTATATANATSLNGSTLQIIIKTYNSDPTERYFFDNVVVTGTVSIDANATVNDMLTCNNTSVTITGSSTAPGVTYSWTGPGGFVSHDAITTAQQPGTYILTVSSGSCTGTASVTVLQNIAQPEASASSNNELTCRRNSTELRGTSPTPGVSYNWTGPQNFNVPMANTATTVPGEYTLTVTDMANGCKKEIIIFVTQDTASPAATATNNGPLSCAVPEVTLSGNSATAGLAYAWWGPDGYSEPTQTAITYTPGVYTLTVTDVRIEGNGCSARYTTEVTEDYSDCLTATTVAAGIADVQEEAAAKTTAANSGTGRFTYTAYPNPAAHGKATIEFTSPQNAQATVTLYNALGLCEKVLFKGAVMANQLNRLPVSQPLSSGVYYYIINTHGKTYAGRLVVLK